MISMDSGSWSDTTGTAEITAIVVSLWRKTFSIQWSTEKHCHHSASPQLPCGKPPPNDSPAGGWAGSNSRRWVCTSTIGSRAADDGVGDRRLRGRLGRDC